MKRTSARPYDDRDKMHRSSKRDFDYDRYRDRSRERDRSRDRRSRSRDRGYSKYHRDRSPYSRGGNGRRDRRDSRSKDRSRSYRNERSERDRSRDGRRNDRDAGKRLTEKRSRSSERPRDTKGTPRSRSRSPLERKSENLAHFGDWRQHISSSGKTFYYNSVTEVSQWEKPKEWLDREKQKETKENTPPARIAQVVKVIEDASPVSEDSPISSSDDEDEGQTPETRDPEETVLETSPQKPQFLPGSIPTRDQVLQETSPLSDDDDDENRSPSATSSQADQTPPRPDSKTGQASTSQTTTLLPPPVKPMTLSPSLAAYYNEVLISHMTQWQADLIERQAERLQKELFNIGNVHSSSISADLKMARSMVRLAEIQATLQEQRALFLQQQIAQLEDKAFVTSQSSNGA